MATSIRGRSGSRSNYGEVGYSANWGKPEMGHKRTGKTGTTTMVPAPYRTVFNTFQCKINSYKTLYNQTRGPAKYSRPTPTVLNTFANWINKGAIIQTCTKAQVGRWARTTKKHFDPRNATPMHCKNVLGAKFGKSNIKAVACTKSGSFMVVTTPTVGGRTFWFPK